MRPDLCWYSAEISATFTVLRPPYPLQISDTIVLLSDQHLLLVYKSVLLRPVLKIPPKCTLLRPSYAIQICATTVLLSHQHIIYMRYEIPHLRVHKLTIYSSATRLLCSFASLCEKYIWPSKASLTQASNTV